MDKNRIQKFLSSTRVLQFVFFVAAVTLVTYFFPREGKFRYTFQEGKPWKYGLLTAPFDFPVYKDEAVIQQERDQHHARLPTGLLTQRIDREKVRRRLRKSIE